MPRFIDISGTPPIAAAADARAAIGMTDVGSAVSTAVDAAAARTATGSDQALTATAVKTAAYTSALGDLVPVDASSAAVTITLPTAPANNARIVVKKIDTSSNAVTVAAGGSDVFDKAGGATSATLTLPNQSVSLRYKASGGIWYIASEGMPLSRLDSRYPDVRPQSVVSFGDSITDAGYGVSGTAEFYSQRGWDAWANAFLGWRFDLLRNSGISGNTLALMLARIESDVFAYNPSWVWMNGGINDINAGASYATVVSRFEALFAQFNARSIRVVCLTVNPSGALDSGKNLIRSQVNQWLRNYGANNPNVIVVDTAPYFEAPDSNLPYTNYSPDNLHPTAAGGMAMGWAVYKALDELTVKRSPLTAGTDPANILGTYAMMGGDVSGAATGWTKSSAGTASTYSKVARTDGILGDWQRIVTPSGSASNYGAIYLSTDPTTGFSVGDTIYGAVEVRVSGADLATASSPRTWLNLVCVDNALASKGSVAFGYDDTGESATQKFPLDYTATFRTPNIVVPAGTTKLRMILWGVGGATRDWARPVIRKVT
jgi:lysophospholipase L1-like esterase